jgi:hypothetical protein
LGERWKRLWAPFQSAWLHPSGTPANPRFGNQDQQRVDANRIVRAATALLPGDPDLDSMFEAQLPRDLIGQQGGLRHQ